MFGLPANEVRWRAGRESRSVDSTSIEDGHRLPSRVALLLNRAMQQLEGQPEALQLTTAQIWIDVAERLTAMQRA